MVLREIECGIYNCKKKSKYGIKQKHASRCELHKTNGMVTQSRYYCHHGRQKSRCKDCKGGSICEHNSIKQFCKECKGTSLCKHNKRKSRCVECKGKEICIHKKRKEYCYECKGSQICTHGKLKQYCKECGGSQICTHGKQKQYCKECGGNRICKHNKQKSRCKECGGSQICIHKQEKKYCKKCGIGNTLCKNSFCVTSSTKKYDKYCIHCFANMFPDDPRTLNIRKKSKEIKVVSYISQKINGFVHDKPLYVDLQGGCCDSKRRIDLRKLINGTMLCIEIDENQHQGYDAQDEKNRYDNLFMDFSGKYIFIRYNPDKFKLDGIVKNPQFEKRMEKLIELINKQIERIEAYNNTEPVEIIKLFYSN